MDTQTQPNLIAQLAALSQDERTIITTLVERHYDIHTVARDFQLSIVDMLVWLAQPGIKTALDTLRQLAEHALHLRSVEARRTAIDLLEHVALRATSDLEKRRATVALVRATRIEPTRAQRAAAEAGTAPPASSGSHAEPAAEPADSHPTTHPSATNAAEAPADPSATEALNLIRSLAAALANNDHPEHDTGLLELHKHAANGITLNDEPLPVDETDFITALSTSPFVKAVDAPAYSDPQLLEHTETQALIALTITPHSHQPLHYHFHLTRHPASPDTPPSPWLITAIKTTPHPDT